MQEEHDSLQRKQQGRKGLLKHASYKDKAQTEPKGTDKPNAQLMNEPCMHKLRKLENEEGSSQTQFDCYTHEFIKLTDLYMGFMNKYYFSKQANNEKWSL